MKILTKKRQNEILKRIAACKIITDNYIDDIEAYTYMTQNIASISHLIGGTYGAEKVYMTAINYDKERKNEEVYKVEDVNGRVIIIGPEYVKFIDDKVKPLFKEGCYETLNT